MMYVPAHFEVTDIAILRDMIVKYPLGTWIVSNSDELVINHIPFLFEPNRGTHGALIGHVARANPVWKDLSADTSSAVVFQAEQGYISPSWYPTKKSDPRAVPTWNYSVVHVHGVARAIEDKPALLSIVSELTHQHELHRDHPWSVSDAPPDYIDKLLGAIVGIEIAIDSIQGKFKLSQNRSADDRQGVITGLHRTNNPASLVLAERMQQENN
jgi:transcriptional regulator